MSDVITSVEQVTPAWLTDVLHRAGALATGQVTAIDSAAVSLPGISQFTRLQVHYDPAAPPAAPTHLFLKRSPPIGDTLRPFIRNQEVVFYQLVGQHAHRLPLARCYDAASDAATGAYHLLLADLTATHTAGAAGHLPPTVTHSEQMIDALAQIHAAWWDHPQLPTFTAAWPSAASQAAFVAWATTTYPSFADFLGDRLSPQRRRTLEQIIAGLPHLLERLVRGTHLTIIHGDAHAGNVLFPRDPTTVRTVIVDWDWWQISVGPMDLAYQLALMWGTERRAQLERRLVERYHGALQAAGVANYAWEHCWTDYRFAVLRSVFIPIWRSSVAPQPDTWWLLFDRAMAAVADLSCMEVLDA